jgi:holliday junction DNA helicase RuvA
MYAYIRGSFTYKSATMVYLEANGVAFEIQISLNTFSVIQPLKEGTLYTWLQVKEDSHTLFGFAEEKEKEIFLQLISVSGIGANTARVMLSSLRAEEVQRAIGDGNIKLLESVKGIGKKTAERVVLELKDKMLKAFNENIGGSSFNNNEKQALPINAEVIQALMALGIARNNAETALQKALALQPELSKTEELIKAALKQF